MLVDEWEVLQSYFLSRSQTQSETHSQNAELFIPSPQKRERIQTPIMIVQLTTIGSSDAFS